MIEKSDAQLKRDIEQELLWDPRVHTARIGVAVHEGAVSLLGEVGTYPEKWAAEDATKRVSGVRTVAQDLKVEPRGDHRRTDGEIAVAVERSLKWNVLVPATVTASVHDAAVLLGGVVTWDFQRSAAERAVWNLTGVVSVSNEIRLKGQGVPMQVKEKIESALHRQATKDARSIHVAVVDSVVTLTGQASSWQMIRDAKAAAWSAPGVTRVDDEVFITSLDHN